ncbi:MAG: hypothetical protein ACPLPR_08645 [Bacillota bacterium]
MSVVSGAMQPLVIPLPEKLRAAIGEEAATELVQLISQVTASAVSGKVDKSEYDAHAQLIEEKFKRFEERLARHEIQTENMIRAALLKGLAWVTVLIFGLFGALWAMVRGLK